MYFGEPLSFVFKLSSFLTRLSAVTSISFRYATYFATSRVCNTHCPIVSVDDRAVNSAVFFKKIYSAAKLRP